MWNECFKIPKFFSFHKLKSSSEIEIVIKVLVSQRILSAYFGLSIASHIAREAYYAPRRKNIVYRYAVVAFENITRPIGCTGLHFATVKGRNQFGCARASKSGHSKYYEVFQFCTPPSPA